LCRKRADQPILLAVFQAGRLAGVRVDALPSRLLCTSRTLAANAPYVVLSVLAHTICAALRRRLPGYGSATPDTLHRRFLNTGGIILNRRSEIVVRLNRRTY
jgi:hypothetical protein